MEIVKVCLRRCGAMRRPASRPRRMRDGCSGRLNNNITGGHRGTVSTPTPTTINMSTPTPTTINISTPTPTTINISTPTPNTINMSTPTPTPTIIYQHVNTNTIHQQSTSDKSTIHYIDCRAISQYNSHPMLCQHLKPTASTCINITNPGLYNINTDPVIFIGTIIAGKSDIEAAAFLGNWQCVSRD